ncbi:hypothetical protein AXF42_Ash012542 [Apostasia shenzhenica]|uniref:Uncharacterized protein n=1 Tax=Apostasia shenzhenica TaxID=1088818 RepID=A0A2I0AR20_9ASPA|nr:hypothetical protein AXF42_Ash012542 [Apostasia shenzhenica]
MVELLRRSYREELLEESCSTRGFREEITPCRVVSSSWLSCFVEAAEKSCCSRSGFREEATVNSQSPSYYGRKLEL